MAIGTDGVLLLREDIKALGARVKRLELLKALQHKAILSMMGRLAILEDEAGKEPCDHPAEEQTLVPGTGRVCGGCMKALARR